MLLNQVRKLNLTLKHYTMYCHVVDMHETQVYILNYVKKIYSVSEINNTLALKNV